MSKRLRLVLVLGTLILLSLALSACNRERPAPAAGTGTPAARATVAGPTAVGTQVALPTTTGGQSVTGTSASPTPSAPVTQQIVVGPTATGATGTGSSFSYTVQAGDTLATIAARFGTTTEAIAQLNSLPDPNALTLGQTLTIPGTGATTGAGTGQGATTTGGTTGGATSAYTVQAGDTVGSIARRFGTTVQEIVRLNNLTDPDRISLGQNLIVPSGSGSAVAVPTGGMGKSYEVQRGDTLLSIARRFGLTVAQLQEANNITNPDVIMPGQKLVIP